MVRKCDSSDIFQIKNDETIAMIESYLRLVFYSRVRGRGIPDDFQIICFQLHVSFSAVSSTYVRC